MADKRKAASPADGSRILSTFERMAQVERKLETSSGVKNAPRAFLCTGVSDASHSASMTMVIILPQGCSSMVDRSWGAGDQGAPPAWNRLRRIDRCRHCWCHRSACPFRLAPRMFPEGTPCAHQALDSGLRRRDRSVVGLREQRKPA